MKNKLFINFFVYIQVVNNYYQKHKEKLWKEARERYQNRSEEEKDKRRKKVGDRYHSSWRTKVETTWVYTKNIV